jgi:hypothetical protein
MVDVLEKVSQGFEAVKAEAVAAFEAGKFSSQVGLPQYQCQFDARKLTSVSCATTERDFGVRYRRRADGAESYHGRVGRLELRGSARRKQCRTCSAL